MLVIASLVLFSSFCHAEIANTNEMMALFENLPELKYEDLSKWNKYFISDIDTQQKEISFILKDSIDADPNNKQIRYFWKVHVNKDPKQQDHDTLKIYFKANCTTKELVGLQMAVSLKKQIIYTGKLDPADADITYALPNSIGERDLKKVCNVENFTKKELKQILIILPKDPIDFVKLAQDLIQDAIDYKKQK